MSGANLSLQHCHLVLLTRELEMEVRREGEGKEGEGEYEKGRQFGFLPINIYIIYSYGSLKASNFKASYAASYTTGY